MRIRKYISYKFIIFHYYFYKYKLNNKINKIMSYNKFNFINLKERSFPSLSKNKDSKYYKYMLSRYLLLIKYIKNKVILETGCGLGYGSYLISDYPKKIISIDIDKESINFCRKIWSNNKIDFKVLSVLNIVSLNTIFDIIFGIELIEHLNLKECITYLNQCYNNLKNKGLLILSSYFSEKIINKTFKNIYHKKIYSKNELKQIIKNIGFSKIFFINNLIAIIKK